MTDLADISLSASQGGRGMEYSGIGISIGFREDRVVLRQVFEGGPAADAQLAPGTSILRINGVAVSQLNPNQVVQMIRGVSGSELSLDIVRPGSDFQESIRIMRNEVIAK